MGASEHGIHGGLQVRVFYPDVMKCPIDNNNLVMSDRNGVEIDYCPECRGVWLDRGELDKIIDRASQHAPQQPPVSAQNSALRYDSHGSYPKRKRENLLSELFD